MIDTRFRGAIGIAASLILSVLGFACREPTADIVTPFPADPYFALRLNTHVATLATVAPYNTLQLSATAFAASGAIISSVQAVQYSATDTTLLVSPTGLITAKFATAPGYHSLVIASASDSVQGITHVDTIRVAITDQVPSSPLATFGFLRAPGDSAKTAVFDNSFGPQLWADTTKIVAMAANGTDLSSTVDARFFAADSTVLSINPWTGVIWGWRPGVTMVYVETSYYGVLKRDSLRFTIGNPLSATVLSMTRYDATGKGQRFFQPDSITIGVGGTILFNNYPTYTPYFLSLPMEVVFDDSMLVQPSPLSSWATQLPTGAGNIAKLPVYGISSTGQNTCDGSVDLYWPCAGATRAFPHPGTYHYHSAIFGTHGTIVVVAP